MNKIFPALALFGSFAFFACSSTVESDDKCEDSVAPYNIMCAVYDRDECGNIICGNNDSALVAWDSVAYDILFDSIYEAVSEEGEYTTRDSVAAYLCKFDKLPSNYVGKDEGIALYESKTGSEFSKWNFNPWTTLGVMIGGDVFRNEESMLPPDRDYREADVDYSGKNRGTKRLLYSGGCTIYYTADHYESYRELVVR